MPKYGVHPTGLAKLSDVELHAMYRRENWNRLNEERRLELMQETVNRAAMKNGEEGACLVEFSDRLPPDTMGVHSGDRIEVNRQAFLDEKVVMDYHGRQIEYEMKDANIQALETLLHEDIHAWQDQCIDGTIQCSDPDLLREYQANNFDITVLRNENGSFELGQQYLSGSPSDDPNADPAMEEMKYYLYYLQSTERDAFRLSEQRTAEILQELTAKYGNDPSFDSFLKRVQENGFEATLKKAIEVSNDAAVEKDINITLMNQYYGTKDPVTSEAVAEAVRKEMVNSYQEHLRPDIQHLVNAETGNTKENGAAPENGTAAAPAPPGVALADGTEEDGGLTIENDAGIEM